MVQLQDATLKALEDGRLDDARRLAVETTDAAGAAFDSDSPDLANVLLTAAMAEEEAGEFTGALMLAERAAGVAATLVNTDDPELMSLWVDIELACARLLSTLGEFDRAETRLAATARAASRILGPEDQCVLAIHNLRGITAKYDGRFDDAEVHYHRILEVLERQRPVDEDVLAGLLHNLGGLDHSRGNLDKGLAYAERGLRVRLKARGRHHPDVARDLNAIGALHHDAGNAAAAEAAYREALEVFESTLGAQHYEVGMTCANLAVSAAASGDADHARRLYERALTILESSLGPTHPDVALVEHNLAVLLADHGELDQAFKLLERAAAALAESLPVDHPRRTDLRATLTELSSRTGDL